jgi:hypothetical protein
MGKLVDRDRGLAPPALLWRSFGADRLWILPEASGVLSAHVFGNVCTGRASGTRRGDLCALTGVSP